ncbi:MAG: endonuclease MutS2 [Lachnospiraceae bacterium]|nr:endonuclease MutS2 [Lachnospiraceae bacterium]
MNKRALRILEYNKIINMLSACAGSPLGKKRCEELMPSTDIVEIETLQEETEAALSRLYRQGGVSFSGLTDVGLSLKRTEVEGSLSAKELLDIAGVLETADLMKKYGEGAGLKPDSNDDSAEAGMDCLTGLFSELYPLEHLSREIRRVVLSETEIADDASAELKSIRRNIKLTNEKIHSQLSKMVGSQTNQTMLQNNIITMRNGRYCIPVKSEYRGQFPGMLHDQSSTGSTVFIEPMAVVNMNNELKELATKEVVEIERILSALSEQVGAERRTIGWNVENLAKLDFIFARAAFAKKMNATKPIFSTDGEIEIREGRHPLLDKKKVVPIGLRLGGDFNMLIITGPNTGGKTVSLKTLGLLTLMGQSGLHIPALDKSKLRVFEDVFADIGDEQSIEQNLSTFSSHMTHIVSIVNAANERSLVLFDELGGGTDPTEGAALAISILSHLNRQGILTMATTHYSELKTFALTTEGIENACCEFDLETLKPTYRLMIGIPGKSNAFAIAKQLGLPEYIIEEAKGQIDSNTIDFEQLIADLEDQRSTIIAEREEIDKLKEESKALRDQLKEKKQSLKDQRSELLKDAREEARQIIKEAKDYADEAIRKYNKLGKHAGNNQAMERERSKLGNRVKQLDSELSKKKKNRKGTHTAEDFKEGYEVHVISMDMDGVVTGLPNAKGYLRVQMGILNSDVHISDLEIIGDGKDDKDTGRVKTGGKTFMKAANFKPEINLLGLTVDEAVTELDKYLDDAALAHCSSVRIIHGKGTGALRKGVQKYLEGNPYVKSFRAGEFGEGDMGVTVVEIK